MNASSGPHATPSAMAWIDTFSTLRGEGRDGRWAGRVWMTMTVAGAPAEAVDAVLQECHDEVAGSGAAPDDLFGPADDVAREHLERLSLDGATFVEPRWSRWAVVAGALWVGAILSAAMGVVDLIQGPDRIWGWADIATVAVMVASLLAFAEVYRVASRRFSPWLTGGLGLAAAFPVMALAGALPRDSGWGVHSSAWWFALSAVIALAAWGAGRFLPAPDPQPVVVADDADWLRQAKVELLRRDDLTRSQITDRLAEVTEHARHTGVSLEEEFGNPRAFARTLPAHRGVSERRTAVYMTALLGLDLVLLLDGAQPWKLMILGCSALCAGLSWFVALRERAPRAS